LQAINHQTSYLQALSEVLYCYGVIIYILRRKVYMILEIKIIINMYISDLWKFYYWCDIFIHEKWLSIKHIYPCNSIIHEIQSFVQFNYSWNPIICVINHTWNPIICVINHTWNPIICAIQLFMKSNHLCNSIIQSYMKSNYLCNQSYMKSNYLCNQSYMKSNHLSNSIIHEI
jgi:hypothetical protein